MVLKTLLKYKYMLISIFVVLLAIFYTNIKRESKYNINDTLINGYIHSYKIDGNKLSINIKGLEPIIGDYYFNDIKEIEKFKSKYKLGDYVTIEGKLILPKESGLFNQFDYREYLKYNGINYIIKIDKINKKKNNNKIRYTIKNYIIDRIESIPLSKKYLYAFIIGEEYYIDSNIKDSFQKNGISHLFAVSGSNITFVVVILLKLINKFKYKYLLIFMYVLLYMFLTDFTASVVRSGIFFILITLNKIYKKNISIVDLLFITLTFSLIYNPYLIYSVGYQFSFIISFYLILFQKLIKKYSSFIGTSFIVAIIAFLSSLPIVLNNFYEINFFSIILNIIYVPFVSFVLFPISILCFIFPVLDNVLLILTNILEKSSLMFSNIRIFTLVLGKPSFILIILYYIAITLILINNKYAYFMMLLFIYNKLLYFTINPSIEFIDVGQGDSILIRLNKGKDILIDTGGILKYNNDFKRVNEFSLGDDLLVPYLKSMGIDNIDYMFITHGDADHIGGAKDVINNIKIKNLYLNGNINDLEKELINFNPINLKEGDEIKINNINFSVLNPYKETNENDSSIILYFNIKGYSILLMGDASTFVEDSLIEKYVLTVDILKLGHHGSKTSTSNKFINNIKPKYGIISVGENNRFGHPHKSVLDILYNNNVTIFRTDYHGSIKFTFENKLLIKTRRKYEK